MLRNIIFSRYVDIRLNLGLNLSSRNRNLGLNRGAVLGLYGLSFRPTYPLLSKACNQPAKSSKYDKNPCMVLMSYSNCVCISYLMKPEPKAGRRAWPRCPLFSAVRSGTWMARIGRAAVILQKKPRTLLKSTHSPASSLKFFCKKALVLQQNQLTLQSS
jgi:hypothetical protein